MENAEEFRDKTVLVTGSSFGIGRATAVAFARRGANLVLADWVEDEETMKLVKAEGVKAVFQKCDVSQDEQVRALMDRAQKELGGVDYAFNNAGVEGESAKTHECTIENWERTLGINLRGIWLCMKYEIPQMLEKGRGSIVNVASIAGLVGFPGLPAYVASKHAVVGLTKTAALEYAKQGIRVNVVCPGVIKTPMIDRFTGKKKEAEKQFEDMEPVGRMGEPEEVASAAIWLSGEGASFVTGEALAVDGGWIAQ